MKELTRILSAPFLGNPLYSWTAALVIFTVAFWILARERGRLEARLKRIAVSRSSVILEAIVNVVDRTTVAFMGVLSAFLAAKVLVLPHAVDEAVSRICLLVFLIQGAIWSVDIVKRLLVLHMTAEGGEDPSSLTALGLVTFLAEFVIWVSVTILVLDNIGVDVTTLVAGLGIGGVAIALALQNILGDLFSSLSIVLDRPFVVGDFIIVDNSMGTVERIGVKTTRVRSIGGEQLILANGDLLKSRIRNYKRMFERRVVFNLSIALETDREKVKALPGVLAEIIGRQQLVRFDRAHFATIGEYAMVFEVVYFVLTPDHRQYMDIQQAINLDLLEHFDREGITIPYPTKVVRAA